VKTLRNYCDGRQAHKAKGRKQNPKFLPPAFKSIFDCLRFYFPKITQSPCDVPINKSNGSDNQVLVRDAINA